MSAQLEAVPAIRRMHYQDLDRVVAIEDRIYPFPWTRGNFRDSLNAGYDCWVYEVERTTIGYAVLMFAVAEAHLLNLSIATDWQGKGYGRSLLDAMVRTARDHGCVFISLEVRPSNPGAIRLYQKAGFREIALRKGYYPADRGREDALVMGRNL